MERAALSGEPWLAALVYARVRRAERGPDPCPHLTEVDGIAADARGLYGVQRPVALGGRCRGVPPQQCGVSRNSQDMAGARSAWGIFGRPCT